MRNHGADLWAIVSHCFIEEGGLVAFFVCASSALAVLHAVSC